MKFAMYRCPFDIVFFPAHLENCSTRWSQVLLNLTRISRATLRLTALSRLGHARRSPVFCFVGSPGRESGLRVRSVSTATSPDSCTVPPNNARRLTANALGSGPARFSGAPRDTGARKKENPHVSESSQPHRILGKDAEVKTTGNNNSFTALSLATKHSWKDRESGEYRSETTWHRCIVWGQAP